MLPILTRLTSDSEVAEVLKLRPRSLRSTVISIDVMTRIRQPGA